MEKYRNRMHEKNVAQSCYNSQLYTFSDKLKRIRSEETQLNEILTILLFDLVQKKLNDLKKLFDEVSATMASFTIPSREFKLFVKSSRRGDAIAVEWIINQWLRIWNICDRKNYANLELI